MSWASRCPVGAATDEQREEPAEPLTFHVAFRSFVAAAWERVDEAVSRLHASDADLTIDRDVIRACFSEHLNDRLTLIAAQTFTVRLHMARLTGRLGAGGPEARFERWVRSELGDSEALRRLLAGFPVLARALLTVTEGAAEAWSEMIDRLATDWPELAPVGRSEGPDRLVEVKAGLGDGHRGGRSVMTLEFASGWRVVYKPRPMVADAHFQDLVRWLGERGFSPSLRTVTLVDRGDHGWVEIVTAAGCRTSAEVEAFYRRQGALLLLFHLLDTTDIHSENVIAAGEHPVPVDLETLFQSPPPDGPGPADARVVRARVFHRLVLRTLMLPIPMPGTVGGSRHLRSHRPPGTEDPLPGAELGRPEHGSHAVRVPADRAGGRPEPARLGERVIPPLSTATPSSPGSPTPTAWSSPIVRSCWAREASWPPSGVTPSGTSCGRLSNTPCCVTGATTRRACRRHEP